MSGDKDNRHDETPVLSDGQAFIDTLPAHLRTQIANGVIDPANIPKEDLVRLANRGALDGNALELAGRGDGNHPLDYVGRAAEANEADTGTMSPPELPYSKPRGYNSREPD